MSSAAHQLAPVEQKLRELQPRKDLPDWFSEMRSAARDAYFSLPLPHRSNEAWHYGDPSSFSLDGLDIAHGVPGFNGANYERICGLSGRPRRVACLSMVGDNVAEISSSSPLQDAGVDVMALRQALALRGDLVQDYWSRGVVKFDHNLLIASHYALIDNGFFVFIPKGVTAPVPIHLVMESGETGSVVAPHVMIVAEPGSSSQIFVHYLGQDSAERNLQLGVVESHVGDQAELTITKIMHVGMRTDILTHEAAELGHDAHYSSIAVHLGGHHLRHEMIANMSQPGAEVNIAGMYLVRGRQRYDFYTEQNHLAPDCRSKLLFKGAAMERGQANFMGMIKVSNEAQRTDAYQTSRALLLSPRARINSSPQLEIDANDVRCSHGATVSNIDERQVFYLQNRGLSADEARRLIVSGFIAEIADRIPLSTARDYVSNYVLERVK